MSLAYDATRFPAGITIDGVLTDARPVGTIVYDTITNTLQVSLSATVASYQAIGPGATGTAVTALADPGTGTAIPIDKSYAISFVTGATGETNTLAAPAFVGQQMLLTLVTDGGGDRVVTVTSTNGFNQTGNNTITFNDAGDYVKLIGIWKNAAFSWQLVINDGCTLSTV